MTQLDRDKIKKLRTGEILGTAALVFCGAVLIYFVVMFALTWGRDYGVLNIIMWSTAPALMAAGIVAAAFCNIKYGGDMERVLTAYIVDVFVENAALMHPEKSSLSFTVTLLADSVEVSVNNYKDKISFDFSVFGKLSASRKMTVARIITDRLGATFCRLCERGVSFTSVEYREYDAKRNKAGKLISVIKDGVPENKILKRYLKNK